MAQKVNNAFIALLNQDITPILSKTSVNIDRLFFSYMPESFTDAKSANYEGITILGRAEPVRLYGSSGVRSIPLTLQFIAEDSALTDVVQKIDFCQSLTYPSYQNDYPAPPMRVQLHIGNLIDMVAIVTSYSVTYQGPWDVGTDGSSTDYYPFRADVTLTFEEVLLTQVDFVSIINRHS